MDRAERRTPGSEGLSEGVRPRCRSRPHVTVVQRFVRTSELDNVYAAVAKVLKDEKPTTAWELKATGYYDIPYEKLGLAGIVIEPTPDLLRLPTEVDRRRRSVHRPTRAPATAFVPRPDGGAINQPTIDYVTAFVPEPAGRTTTRT